MRKDKQHTFDNMRKESSISYSRPFSRQIRYNLNEYKDFMKTSQKQQLEVVKLIRNNGITQLPKLTIVSQMIVGVSDKDKSYHLDLLTSIQMNLLNPSVSEYHLLQIDNSLDSDIMSLSFADTKIKFHYIGEKINRAIFVKYCNEHLQDRAVVFLNQPDVYFDITLILASQIEYGEYVKIFKRISITKPFDCEVS